MPFDGATPASKLQQLRDLIANVPDSEYHQAFCHKCALGHARDAGLYDFQLSDFKAFGDLYEAAAAHFGLPPGRDAADKIFGCPGSHGPRDRTEFLARVDAILAKVTA